MSQQLEGDRYFSTEYQEWIIIEPAVMARAKQERLHGISAWPKQERQPMSRILDTMKIVAPAIIGVIRRIMK